MLRILGQRDDGYHLLQTYFQLVNWGDEIEFILSQDEGIKLAGDFGQLRQKDNLIDKAARLLIPFKKCNKGICINVSKNIPQGSGLGGGSSNAATTLRILNDLWQCKLSQLQLQQLAIQLGADVPIFVLNQSAMATGIGEILQPLALKSYFFVLIFPKTSIPTAKVFSSNHLNRNQTPLENSAISNKDSWTNACLPVVLENYPEVAEIYRLLSKTSPIYMSGTGSTLFSCFDSKTQAQEFCSSIPSKINHVLCQGLDSNSSK